MNKRERILTSAVIVCFALMSVILIEWFQTNANYEKIVETASVLEIQGFILPKVYVGEHRVYGGPFNFSIWEQQQESFVKRYAGHFQEIVEIMKMQVALLGEDPVLFERCLYSIYDIQEYLNSTNKSMYFGPYVAWKGRYGDCPITFHYSEESKELNETEVWAITILGGTEVTIPDSNQTSSFIWIIPNTYFVDIEMCKTLPFVSTIN